MLDIQIKSRSKRSTVCLHQNHVENEQHLIKGYTVKNQQYSILLFKCHPKRWSFSHGRFQPLRLGKTNIFTTTLYQQRTICTQQKRNVLSYRIDVTREATTPQEEN